MIADFYPPHFNIFKRILGGNNDLVEKTIHTFENMRLKVYGGVGIRVKVFIIRNYVLEF